MALSIQELTGKRRLRKVVFVEEVRSPDIETPASHEGIARSFEAGAML